MSNEVYELNIYLGRKNHISSFEDFEKSGAPCNSCLVQATCVKMVKGGKGVNDDRISFRPCNEIITHLVNLDVFMVTYSSERKE